MGDLSIIGTVDFPQTNDNRTREETAGQLLQFTGGTNRPEAKVRAAQQWDMAVKYFNTWPWKFNRVTQDITLVANDFDYTLNTNFRSPWIGMMVDANNFTRQRVIWIPYSTWTLKHPDQSTTGSVPLYYTALNAHETGLVIFSPTPGTSVTWPTFRIIYHRFIAPASGAKDKLQVPEQVEQAIFEEAAARVLRTTKRVIQAREQLVIATRARIELESEQRDYIDQSSSAV